MTLEIVKSTSSYGRWMVRLGPADMRYFWKKSDAMQFLEDKLKANGYDYRNQAWVVDGRYVACSHPASMKCNYYGTVHAGEPLAANADVH